MWPTWFSIFFAVWLFIGQSSINADQQNRHVFSPTEMSKALSVLLKILGKPVRVTALICWDTKNTMLFVRNLYRKENERMVHSLLVVPVSELFFPRNVQDEHHELILVDVGCETNSIRTIFNKSPEQLKRNYKWVLVNTKEIDVIGLMEDYPILPLSEIYHITNKEKGKLMYTKLYRIADEEPITQEHYGVYVNGTFYLENAGMTSLELRRNLHGKKHFRSTIILRDRRTIEKYRNYTDLSVDTYLKTTIWLLVELLQYANASMSINQTETYGSYNKSTGKWTHLFGKFQERLTDFALAPIFIIHERVPMLQYMVTTHALDAYFLFRRPNLAVTDNIFMASFDSRVWTCTILLILLLAVVLAGMIYYEQHRGHHGMVKLNETKPVEVSDSIVLVVGAACQQGSSNLPHSLTARIVIICCFISLMFLFTSYSACIVVLLQSPSNKIQTLQQLYDSRFKLGLHHTTWNVQVFKIQTDPLKKAVFNNRVKNPDGTSNLYTIEEGMQRVRDGSVALHLEETVAYEQVSLKFMDSEKCALKSIQYLHKPEPYVSMVKNSSYYEIARVGMLRIIEHGIANRHYRRIYTTKPDCTGRIAMFTSATLLDTLPAFLIIAWGFAATLGILFGEIIFKKIGHRIQRKTPWKISRK